MSRIGKSPITVPSGVDLKIAGQTVTAKGKLGQLQFELADDVEVKLDQDKVTVSPRNDSRKARQLWGTSRTVVSNMVKGVSTGFTEQLEITGVGYKAAVQGQDLVLNVGYTHEVRYPVPTGIQIKCDKPTSITITGADKQQVGQVAAEIRGYQPPEPYQGKGIRYSTEVILRKEGKKK